MLGCNRQVIPYDEALEHTVFALANDMLKDICQRFGQTQLQFVSNAKTALTRRPRTGTSKVWESAKASLDLEPDKRTEADVENIIKFSKRLPFFKYVSTSAREALCRTMQHMVLQEGEVAIKGPKDCDFVWFIVVKGRCDMMLKTEETGKYYPMRAFEEGDTFAHSYLKMLTGDANANELGDIRAREANTSLVRVYVEEEHRGDFRSQTKPLLYEELAKYFNMAADQAADRLGLCMSAIKKICRRHGIIRWPHRKLLSANKSLALIDSKMMEVEQNPQSQAILRNEAITVLVSKLRVMLNPTYLVNSELVQVQPSGGSGQQVPGRVDDIFELEGSLSPHSEADDSDGEPGGGSAKRKKHDGGKDAKDKKPRTSDLPNKAAHLSEGVHGAPEAASSAGGMVWKQEPAPDSTKSGMLAALAGLPLRRGDKSNGIPGMPSMHAAPCSHAHGEHRLSETGANGGGDFSIEYLSNMVRASLEKVPANVRDQVLSSVITGMHSGTAGSQGPGGAAVSHAHAAQSAQTLHQMPAAMSAGIHSYMKLSNIMQDGHNHQQHVHDSMAAKQSSHGAHMMHAISNQMHAMPGHKAHAQQTLNQGAHSRGEFPPGLRMYQELSALGPNATRHDESSDDEAAPASLSAPWAGQDQRGNGQMAASRGMQPWGQLDKILLAAGPGGGGNGQAYGMPGRASMPLSAHELQSYSRPQGSLPLNLMPPLNGVMGAKNGVGVGKQGQHEQLQQSGGAHMSLPSSSGDMQHDNRAGKGMELLSMLSAPHQDASAANKAVSGSAGGGEQGKGNGGGEAQQGGLWANIHLLCDLLGGPLGQVGQLTQAPSKP
eukprot:Tamp_03077.p1 GENE.Tamp_03077~~Tamp_03077.p1  ORF type:complete len:830 (+),score=206.90 Tamp_03077:924-3413(+)